jgi:hypothetical protein
MVTELHPIVVAKNLLLGVAALAGALKVGMRGLEGLRHLRMDQKLRAHLRPRLDRLSSRGR